MTFRARHKLTGKIIEARKLENDPIWKSKVNDEWIHDIGIIPLDIQRQLDKKGITEIKVSFIKSHSRKEERVRAHFRKENIEGINLDNLENESEEHKLCKEGVYYKIIDDKLLIDFGEKEAKKISELCLGYDCNIEERLSNDKNSKVGDVVVTFDKEHSILGKGIVFEIQFSNQSLSKTIVRTNDRVLRGYSVSWLWIGSFNDKNNLLNDKVKVVPFRIAMKRYDKLFEEGILNNYEFIRNNIEQKLQELDNKEKIMYSNITKSVNVINDEVEKRTKDFYGQFDNVVEGALKEFNPKLLKSVQEKTDNALKEMDIKKEITSIINSKVVYFLNYTQKNFENLHIKPKMNQLDNEINDLLDTTKEKYNSILSEKINSLIEDKKDEFFIEAINKAIKDIPEEISKKFKDKLELYTCENCGKTVPFTDIHWRGSIKHIALCKECWIALENPLNERRDKNEKEESESLERFSG